MNEQQAREQTVAMFREATPAAPDAPMEEWRDGFEAMAAKIPLADNVSVEPVDADGVPCLKVTAPGVSSDRLVIHYHSGGYVMGSAHAYREFASRLSEATGAPVLLPDYRLAPEHPYPAAAEDALTVYEWCLKSFDSSKLMLTGDSAGGGLCMATLMNIRDKGLPAPTCAVPISPLLDLAGEGDSANIETDPLINRDLIVGAAFRGFAVKSNSVISPALGFWHNADVNNFQTGTDLAKSILEEAGYEVKGGALHYPDGVKETLAE